MYHCYFLINYIGPPKVFFLSFGLLFKKFAHHWFIRTGKFRERSEEGGSTEEREGETKKLEKGVLI